MSDCWGKGTSMNITKSIGMLLLAIYLMAVGIIGLGFVSIGSLHILVALLALASGILILIGK